tara:strand:- start:32 stop:2146 length:2115 start_codon:yes stop_codon:yes gene_type:complete
MDINWQEYFQLKKTREKEAESTKKSFKKSRLVGTNEYLGIEADELTKALFSNNLRNKKDLQFLFEEFKKQGLIPEFIYDGKKKIPLKTPEDLTNYVEKKTSKQIKLRDANKPNELLKKEKGINPINRYKGKVLNDLIKDEARRKLKLSGEATEEALESIENLRWQGLPLAVDDETGEIKWAARQLRDKVPQAVIDFGNTHKIPDLLKGEKQFDADGNVIMKKAFPEGAGDKWAKWARKSWEDMRLENQTFRSIFGFDFDRGHWIPSAWGGPNTKRNASAEAARDYINKYGRFIFGNRDKGDMPNLSTMHAHRELGGSATWLQDFIEWQLDQEGLNANQLPESHWLSHGQNAIVQDQTLNPREFDKIKNIDDVNREKGLKQQQSATYQLAINQKRLDVLNQEREFFNTLREAGLIPPEDVPLIEKQLNQIQTGEWYNRDETFGKYGSADKAGYISTPKKTPIQQILGVKQKTNKFNGISEAMNSIVPVDLNPPDNYEVNFTPRNPNPNGNGNGNGNGVNGKNGNGLTVNGKNGKNGILKGLDRVNNYSGITKLGNARRADQAINFGLQLAGGNYGGAAVSATTITAAELLKSKAGQKRIAAQFAKIAAKQGGKTALKLIPGLDVYISGREAWDYLRRGRFDQAGIAALSGAIGWIPVVGDAGSAALDLTNTGISLKRGDYNILADTDTNKKNAKGRTKLVRRTKL